jgi:hypothetical protein
MLRIRRTVGGRLHCGIRRGGVVTLVEALWIEHTLLKETERGGGILEIGFTLTSRGSGLDRSSRALREATKGLGLDGDTGVTVRIRGVRLRRRGRGVRNCIGMSRRSLGWVGGSMLLRSGDENHTLRGNLSRGVLIMLRIKVVVWISLIPCSFWEVVGRFGCANVLRRVYHCYEVQ